MGAENALALGSGFELFARARPLKPWSFAPKRRRHPVLNPIEQLTEAQRECLRLVFQHMTSKDIARTLGVSPHTVDMRLRTAMRVLDVANRVDAARLLVAAEGNQPLSDAEAYQPLIYQPSDVANDDAVGEFASPTSTQADENLIQNSDPRIRSVVGPPASGPPRLAGASRPEMDDQYAVGQPERYRAVRSPPWGAHNTLGVGERLLWIALIAIGSAMAFGAIISALEALKNLL